MRQFLISSSAILVMAFSTPVLANDKDIADLQSFVDYQMAYTQLLSSTGGWTFDFDGEPKIENKDAYYQITFPAAEMGYADFKLTSSPVLINAKKGQGSNWNMSAAVPSTMDILSKATESETFSKNGQITIGSQDLKMIWNPDLNIASFAKLSFGDVSIANTEGLKANAETVLVATNFTKLDQKEANLITKFDVQNITLSDSANPNDSFKIASITSDATQIGLNVVNYSKAIKDFQTIMKDSPVVVNADGSSKPQIDFNILSQILETSIQAQAKESVSQNSINGISAYVEKKEDNPQLSINIDNLVYDVSYKAVEDLGEMDTLFKMNNLKIASKDSETQKQITEFSNYIPQNIVMDMGAKNIPIQGIMDMTSKFMGDLAPHQDLINNPDKIYEQTPEEVEKHKAEMAKMENNMKDFWKLFHDAQTSFSLSSFQIAAPKYTITTNGQGQIDPDAAHNFFGNLTVKLAGLDAIIEEMTSQITQKDTLTPEQKQQAQGGLMFIPMLKGMGKAVAGENGEIEYHYAFVLGKDGNLTMNGQDLSGMAQMFGGAPTGVPTDQTQQ